MKLRSILIVLTLISGNLISLYGQIPASFTSDGNGDFATATNWAGDVAPPNPIPPGVTVTINHAMTNSGILENNGTINVIAPGSFTNMTGATYRGKGTFTGSFINNGTVAPGSTVVLPTLSTTVVTSIAGISAISGGTISNDGGETLSARGVCWSTSPDPTISLSTKTSDAGNPFVSNITGLTERTTYYVRAYATNSAGTAYGNELTFTTNCGPVTFTYNGSTVTYGTAFSAGRCWLDRNLGAGQVATASDDAAAYGDIFQWGRLDDGHQLRSSSTTNILSNSDNPGHNMYILSSGLSNYDWRSPANDNLWQGLYGINNPCPGGFRVPATNEWNTEIMSWDSNDPDAAFNSPLRLTFGGFRDPDFPQELQFEGLSGHYYSSSIVGVSSELLVIQSNNSFIRNILRGFGMSVRCIKDDGPAGSIGSMNCAGSAINGTLTDGVAAAGVSASVPFTGGNGGSYAGQTVTSTGVTGLNAYLYPGVFNNGAGNLIYSISGIPLGSGTATFALNIGGQSCNLNVTVACNNSFVTQVVEVTSAGGRTWMDRNLGAHRAATGSTDNAAYGYLYQWGRLSDGHQCRTSPTIATLSNSDVPGHDNYIMVQNSLRDWRSPQNSDLWQGVNGINNPCPTGFRLPTDAEWNSERLSWSTNNAAGAFASPLKLPLAGLRFSGLGLVGNEGLYVGYWTSSPDDNYSWYLYISSSGSGVVGHYRAEGLSVRCIKDNTGTIGSLNCGNANITGTLTEGVAASGVSASVPYSGGNGGIHSGQTVISTGVIGLSASTPAGNFTNGEGNLVYTITGTPLGSGTATFALSIGGQTCDLNINVACNPGFVTQVAEVTSAGGKIWMDRNLGAHRAATSSTDEASYGYLYQWGRLSDGHQCRASGTTPTLSVTDNPGHDDFITNNINPQDWRNPQNTDLWQGVNGVNNPCPNGFRLPTYTEWEAERVSWNQQNAEGAFASPLKLPSGGERDGTNGNINHAGAGGLYHSATVSGTKILRLGFNDSFIQWFDIVRSFGFSVRCIKDYAGTIGSLDCPGATITGTLTEGVAASGVSASVAYTGGNGGSHSGQTVGSTGVTGLTATTPAGYFANGSGNLTYNITGTPVGSGTATFALNIGGQSCNLQIAVASSFTCGTSTVSFTYHGSPVTYGTVVSTGNRCWLDRNLGASRVANASNDEASYGDLYQWGRLIDGHEYRNSGTINTTSNTDVPGHANFITNNTDPWDWRIPQNNNLWQGSTGVNNPCPAGYRLPSESELNTERLGWASNDAAGAFGSSLKLPAGGYRYYNGGAILEQNFNGYYWSGTADGQKSWHLAFNSNTALTGNTNRAFGFSVRCIKD
jgi:uncharacterized protein (TIGR02145 family)